MRYWKSAVIVATLMVGAANVAPVFAQPADRNPNSPGNGWGPPGTRGAPGPVAAAGLPFLIAMGAVGGYRLIRRRRANEGQPGQE